MRIVVEREGELYEFKSTHQMCSRCDMNCDAINTDRVKDLAGGRSICRPLAVMAGHTRAYTWEKVS